MNVAGTQLLELENVDGHWGTARSEWIIARFYLDFLGRSEGGNVDFPSSPPMTILVGA